MQSLVCSVCTAQFRVRSICTAQFRVRSVCTAQFRVRSVCTAQFRVRLVCTAQFRVRSVCVGSADMVRVRPPRQGRWRTDSSSTVCHHGATQLLRTLGRDYTPPHTHTLLSPPLDVGNTAFRRVESLCGCHQTDVCITGFPQRRHPFLSAQCTYVHDTATVTGARRRAIHG